MIAVRQNLRLGGETDGERRPERNVVVWPKCGGIFGTKQEWLNFVTICYSVGRFTRFCFNQLRVAER